MDTGKQRAAAAAAQFQAGSTVKSALPYGEGHINDTFLIEMTAAPHRYILQRINTNVFANPEMLMQNVVAVTEYLQSAIGEQGGNPAEETMTVIPAKDGRAYFTANDGTVWRMYIFIEKGISFQTAEPPQALAASAKAFGRFAKMLDGFPAAQLHETIPHFHDTPRRLQNLKQALEADACARAAGCGPEIDFVLQREKDCRVLMDLLAAGELPLRVTHNDTKLNNVLIDPDTLRGVCVIDLDTVMPGLIHNDFGDAIRTGATTAAEDERDLSKVEFSLPLYQMYARSYLEELGDILKPKEREMLPWGAKLMALECGMRFLTDHLEGDVYFKTHRPNHNLDRTRTQLKLVQDMEQHWDEMTLTGQE